MEHIYIKPTTKVIKIQVQHLMQASGKIIEGTTDEGFEGLSREFTFSNDVFEEENEE